MLMLYLYNDYHFSVPTPTQQKGVESLDCEVLRQETLSNGRWRFGRFLGSRLFVEE